MKLVTYNVNGIRSALAKNLLNWLKEADADILCFQEIKADLNSVPTTQLEDLGYHCYWFPAAKKGYSGVAICTKTKPQEAHFGSGEPIYDDEGRHLLLDFGTFAVLNVYAPSGTTGDERQNFKYGWMEYFQNYAQALKATYPHLFICGDFNICHKPIDIHNPVSNAKSSGFLPEERAWMDKFINQLSWTDTFRHFNQQPHHYTWWSYRAGARARNLGWRIDYIFCTPVMNSKLQNATIHPDAMHSDHCPMSLEFRV
jgi:exodeoxyribonuclease-3